jgi:D-alanyl-D-alanine carboxypeptidase
LIYTIVMRKLIACLFLLLAAAAPHAAFAADSPVLETFKQWLDSFNSADKTKIAAFWQMYSAHPDEDRVSRDLRLREMTEGMTIDKVLEDTGTHLVVRMKEGRGTYSESTMDLASENPAIVGSVSGHPIPSPEGSAGHSTNDAELAQKVTEYAGQPHGSEAFSGAILIAHNDKVVLNRAWGEADSERHIANTTGTQFCIGSMNKMFTSVAILQLVSQGKLALDKPIAAYWPDYPNHDLAARVTIRELLSHTGGTGDIFTPEYEAHRLETRTLADYVRLFGSRPVRFEPGTRMEYSNYGFILLGRLIEIASGQTYDAYVRDHIFIPAGMQHTDSRPEADHVAGRAIGYARRANGLEPNTASLPWSGTSAGGGYSTVNDLFLFARALASGKLLDAALLKKATQGGAENPGYGFGFYVLPDGGFGHGGGQEGINGEMHILPHGGYVLVALANRDPRMASDMVDRITSILP